MKKLKNLIVPSILAVILSIGVQPIKANAAQVSPQSGGLVSRSVNVTLHGSPYYSREFYSYLTDSWGYISQYTVSASVTASSSTSVNVTSEAIDKLKIQVGYGTSKSTTYSIGAVIPADSSRLSKLAYDVQFKKQSFTQTESYRYFDTSTGYYDRVYTTNATYKIPTDSWIYVKY